MSKLIQIDEHFLDSDYRLAELRDKVVDRSEEITYRKRAWIGFLSLDVICWMVIIWGVTLAVQK